MARGLKPAVLLLGLSPVAWLVWRAVVDDLGVNSVETLNRTLGDWALRFLLLALAVTPLRRLTGWAALARLRRMVGLLAFFYACLHVGSYVGLDQFFDWSTLLEDVVKRTYITLGMAGFALLLPLAVTSSDGMVRRLGGRAWRRLHGLVFPAAVLAVAHYWMMVKADIRQPAVYAMVLAVLLGSRLWARRRA